VPAVYQRAARRHERANLPAAMSDAGPGRITANLARFYDQHHDRLERARRARRYFYGYLERVLRARVPPGLRVLDVGCGSGDLLASLRPSAGVGLDLSARAVAAARQRHGGGPLRFLQGDAADPGLLAEAGGPFDAVLLVNVVTQLEDVQATLEALQAVCHRRTRILVYSYSRLWQPVFTAAEALGSSCGSRASPGCRPRRSATCCGWPTSSPCARTGTSCGRWARRSSPTSSTATWAACPGWTGSP